MATAKSTPTIDNPPPKPLDGFFPDPPEWVDPPEYIDEVQIEDVPDED